MENTKMIFELSPKQLKYKNILNKDFLELEVYAISDINPNRNDTHFTLEGMEKALPTFKNKPILGFFDRGDFTTHEGHMTRDMDLDQNYWDTTNGERILGFIRESDTVDIVEDKGLHWIRFTCVLCVRYCYKQVKRLLRDKTKKVSVEITVHGSNTDDAGIQHITDFTLDGTTILGSKNGRPVLEGIEGAHLSVLSVLDENALTEQKQALTFAYKEFSDMTNTNDIEKNIKEEEVMVKDQAQNNQDIQSLSCEDTQGENLVFTDNTVILNDADKASDDNNNAPVAQNNTDNTDNIDNNDNNINNDANTDDQVNDDGVAVNDDVNNEDVQDDNNPDYAQQYAATQTLLDEMTEKYNKATEELNVMSSYKQQYEACNAEKEQLQQQLTQYADYQAIKDQLADANAKLFSIKCTELLSFANKMMDGENILDSDKKAIEEKCTQGLYANETEISNDIAVAVFKTHCAEKKTQVQSYEAPVPVIEVSTQNPKKSMNRKERLEKYAAGNK